MMTTLFKTIICLLILCCCDGEFTIKNNLHHIRSMKKYLLQTTFYSVLFLQPLFFSIPTAAWSISSPPQLIDNTYVASDNPKFSFKYSNDLKLSPKLLKTHNKEVFLKSEEVKGFNVGITVSIIIIIIIESSSFNHTPTK